MVKEKWGGDRRRRLSSYFFFGSAWLSLQRITYSLWFYDYLTWVSTGSFWLAQRPGSKCGSDAENALQIRDLKIRGAWR